jgi:hypothetical protein
VERNPELKRRYVQFMNDTVGKARHVSDSNLVPHNAIEAESEVNLDVALSEQNQSDIDQLISESKHPFDFLKRMRVTWKS